MPTKTPQTEAAELIRSSGMRHVAIIMDGNRRWAKKRLMPTLLGHKKGVDTLRDLVRYASDNGLEALTVYAFSTENWQRGDEEVGYLMKLFLDALAGELEQLHRNNVQIRFIGDLQAFPKALQNLIADAHQKTAANTGLKFQIAANYGGRYELVQAMQQIGAKIQSGELSPDAITEDTIREHLYAGDLPDPDLLIRTGGDFRTSNYLLWQCAYTELYITDTLWPDFKLPNFDQALRIFAKRERRYGQ